MKKCYPFFLAILIHTFIAQGLKAQSNVSIIAGNGSSTFSGDGGPATAASVSGTQGICYDGSGNLYFMDVDHNRVRKIDLTGTISTVVGTGTSGYFGDGGPATAAKINAYGVSCDMAGNLYIGDWFNNRVRRVDATTGIITTIAGNGMIGTSGDGGPATAAEINEPIDAHADLANNVYISEYGGSRIRRVDAITGIITTIAAGGEITSPCQLTVDAADNVLIADQSGFLIKVDPSGVVTTVAGGGSGTASGVPATSTSLSGPEGVAVDCLGNIFIADNDDNLIRKVDPSGIITTVAGGGTTAVTYAGVPALSANFHNELICFDNIGNLYVTDDEAPYVYKITNTSPTPTAGAITGPSSLCTGARITLSDTVPGGVWSITPPGIATVSTSGIVTGLSGGTATISYNVINVCGTYSVTTVITVFPSSSTIVGNTPICAGATITLSDAVSGGTWSSESMAIATVGSASGVVTGVMPGTSIILYSLGAGCAATAVVTVDPIPEAETITGPSSLCVGTTIALSASSTGGTWSAVATGIATISTSGVVTGVSAGTAIISYYIANSCGTATATMTITVNLDGSLFYYNDTVVCDIGSLTLNGPPGYSSYLWNNGSTEAFIIVTAPGTYWDKASNICGSVTDTINVTVGLCDIGLPKAFSPNGDGSNDVLYVRGAGIKTLDLRIYNRFGQLVFETKDQKKGWDGTYNGQPQPIDAYGYVLKASIIDGTSKELKGSITLLR